MRRLHHNNEWYDEISPNALSEAEFERLLIQNAHLFSDGAFMTPFKKLVTANGDGAKADLRVAQQFLADELARRTGTGDDHALARGIRPARAAPGEEPDRKAWKDRHCAGEQDVQSQHRDGHTRRDRPAPGQDHESQDDACDADQAGGRDQAFHFDHARMPPETAIQAGEVADQELCGKGGDQVDGGDVTICRWPVEALEAQGEREQG